MPDATRPPWQGRLLIVSNRLPVTLRESEGGFETSSSTGGVAVGLQGFYRSFGATWIGWPGVSPESEPRRRKLAETLGRDALVPVYLTRREVRSYYDGFCNGVIWPLCHYLLDRVPLDTEDWDSYRDVNQKFADVVVERYKPGDLIWVHDYHLMLLPALLRERLPDARIGFFLHIPFPAYEVFRILPWRRQILEGLLGSNLVGLHTRAYVRHLENVLRHEYDLRPREGAVRFGGRDVRLSAFPMAADVERFRALSATAEVEAEAASVRDEAGGRSILLGVDRLDYTKGIPRRLLAFQRLLEREPELRDRVRLIQVAVPSRETSPAYEAFRRQVEALVGKIGGHTTTVASTPIHYLHRSLTPEELTALYLAADVMLVTPLRDGMNLVAKEFIACRHDDGGVLVLSEFAGAAEELSEAVVVNPYDVDGLSREMKRALEMDGDERRLRMRALRHRVLGHDVTDWAVSIVSAIHDTVSAPPPAGPRPDATVRALVDRLPHETPLLLLLDYDGTLVPFASEPDQASPTQALLTLLRRLGEHPRLTVAIVSGRPRETLERWFGELPIDLWAEHGLWRRSGNGSPWELMAHAPRDWMPGVRDILNRALVATPGALVEEKTASLAWHYRRVEPTLARERLEELRELLPKRLEGQPVELLHGSQVLEIRPTNVHKGTIVQLVTASAPPGVRIVAIGDDRTDEDMFAALPDDAVAIHVGEGPTAAEHRIAGPAAVHALLEEILEVRNTELEARTAK